MSEAQDDPRPGRQQRAAVGRQQKAEQAEAAWRLRVRGLSEREIGEQLGISQPTVHRLLERAEREVLAEVKAMVLRLKARQHSRLEAVYVEALAAYERSKRKGGKTIAETQRASADLNAPVTGTKVKREEFERDGDPAWLGVILQTHDRIAALWGLNAPPKAPQERTPDPMEAMSDAELLLAAERELAEERRKLLGAGDAQGDAA